MAQPNPGPIMGIWDNINCSTIMWFLSLFHKDILQDVEKFIQREMNVTFSDKDYCELGEEEEIEKNSKYDFKFNHIKIYNKGIICDFTLIKLNPYKEINLHLTIKNTSPPPEQIRRGNTQAHIRFDESEFKDELSVKFNYELPVSINIYVKPNKCISARYGIDFKDLNMFITSCLLPGINFLFSIFSLNDIDESLETNKNLIKYKTNLNKDKKILQKNTINFNTDFNTESESVEIKFCNYETLKDSKELKKNLKIFNNNILNKIKLESQKQFLKDLQSRAVIIPKWGPNIKTPVSDKKEEFPALGTSSSPKPPIQSKWGKKQKYVNYKEKYLKYKQKYLELKNKLN
jgi:hypothetical protein